MLDELMDMFDRDKRHGSGHSSQKRGLRGMLGRLLGDDADERPDRRHRADDIDHQSGDRRRHRRERDAFDFDE